MAMRAMDSQPQPGSGPASPTCFGSIDHARDRAFSIASALEAMVDTLCGPEPTSDDPRVSQPAPDSSIPVGLLDTAMGAATGIMQALERIKAAMQRLGAKLP